MLALSVAGALAVTAVAAVAPAGRVRAATLDAPVITVADGNSVIALQTSGDGLRFYWNEYGTSNWHGQQVAGNGSTFSQPAIAEVGNTVVIAAQGISNTLDLYWQTEGDSGWHLERVAGTQTTYSAPSLAQDGSTTVIAAVGPSDSLEFYWAVNGTTAWHQELVAGAGTTISAPSLAVNIGAVNIAAEGGGGSLDYYWALNGSTTWHPELVAGAGSIQSAPALSAHDGFANIAALKGGAFVSVFYWAANGSTTWALSTLPPYEFGPSSIAAFPGRPGGVNVVARGLLGMTEETDLNGSGTWQSTAVCSYGLENNTSPPCAATTPSITMNGSSANIADEDIDGNLDFYWQDSNGIFHAEVVDTAAHL
jgi:hypothetical protein